MMTEINKKVEFLIAENFKLQQKIKELEETNKDLRFILSFHGKLVKDYARLKKELELCDCD